MLEKRRMFIKIEIFWLKSAIMNFERFPRAMRGDFYLVIPGGVGTIWTKFQLFGIFSGSEAISTSILNEVSDNFICTFAQ